MQLRQHRCILTTVLLFTLPMAACEESRESEKESLDLDKQRIIVFARTSQCSENTECRYSALGAKPCGGPREYVVYSTSLDTTMLLPMILAYNAREDAFNKRWGIASDCSVQPPPDSVRCENGVCVGYWNGIAR